MKIRLALAIAVALSAPLVGQETHQILFHTLSSAQVINALNGRPIGGPIGDTVSCGLYYAPDGVTNLAEFIYAPPEAERIFGGTIIGGLRDLYLPTNSTYAMVQVRVWEPTYGNNYEAAAAAPPMNGRTALLGVSEILRLMLPPPPEIVPNLNGLHGWTVNAVYVRSLRINNVNVAESTNGTVNANFTVSLVNPGPEDTVRVDYATEDGDAFAGEDYVATNGTLVFNPGETNKTITVVVTADLPWEDNEVFYVRLSNPVNGWINAERGICVITETRIQALSVDTYITFNTVVGRSYILERSADMITWDPAITDIVGLGGNMTLIDVGSGCNPQNYYRARMLTP